MNEPFDSLEAELKALRPHGLSPQSRQRIASELNAAQPAPITPRSRLARLSAPIALLVAACLLIAFVLRPASNIHPPEVQLAPPHVPSTAAFDDALPTVWTYRRALTRSPLAAEDLLDKHAALAPRGHSSSSPVFVRSPSALLLHGEL
jgi:hypothetical protein